MGSTQLGGLRDMDGHTHGVMAVEQTSMPARRKAPMSRMLSSAWAAVGPKWTRASGGRADERVEVVGGRRPRPARSRRARRRPGPTLSGLLTPTPTSSKARMADDLGDHHLPDEAGAPHHHPLRRGRSSHHLAGVDQQVLPGDRLGVVGGEERRPRRPPRRPRSSDGAGTLPTMSSSTSSAVTPWLAAVPFTYISTFGPHIHDGTTMLQRMLSGPSSSAR